MNCNCKWFETIVALLILVFSFWRTTTGDWIIIIAAIALLLHSWVCKNCGMCKTDEMPMPSKKKKK